MSLLGYVRHPGVSATFRCRIEIFIYFSDLVFGLPHYGQPMTEQFTSWSDIPFRNRSFEFRRQKRQKNDWNMVFPDGHNLTNDFY